MVDGARRNYGVAMVASRLLVILAAAMWSTGGAAIKLCQLSPWQIAGGRSLVAGLLLFLLFRSARVRPDRHIAWAAAAYAATVLLFVIANKLTTAANAIFIQDSAPLYVLVLSPLIVGERATKGELFAAPVYVLGIVLFFLDQLSPGQLAGNLLALASGVSFALCIMGLRRLRERGADAAAAWGNLLAVAAALPWVGQGPPPRATDVALVLFLGVFQLGLAYAMFARGLRGVTAVEASLLMLLEPVLNPVWTFLLTGERPGPWAVAGGAIILAATAWRTLAPAGRPPKDRS